MQQQEEESKVEPIEPANEQPLKLKTDPSNPSDWKKIAVRRRHIAICITGHGFGHAVRVLQVAKKMLELEPTLLFTLITPVAEWFLRDTFRAPFRLLPLRMDIGTVQSDAIEADPLATLKRYTELVVERDKVFETLKQTFADTPIDMLLVDLPPLGAELGAWLGVPTVAIGNFSWDWIYGEYVEQYPEYAWIIEEIRLQYSSTSLMLELPYAGDLSAFPHREEIPWICRKATVDPADVRKKLGLDPSKPIALVSFGGIGMSVRLPEGALSNNIDFIVTAPLNGMIGKGRTLDNAELAAAGLSFTDLLRAATVVVSKPGYGIVSECIAAKVPLLYSGREHFREYALLVEGMKRHVRCELLTNEMMVTGNWQPAFEALLSKRTLAAEPDPDVDGESIAAEEIFNLMN